MPGRPEVLPLQGAQAEGLPMRTSKQSLRQRGSTSPRTNVAARASLQQLLKPLVATRKVALAVVF